MDVVLIRLLTKKVKCIYITQLLSFFNGITY